MFSLIPWNYSFLSQHTFSLRQPCSVFKGWPGQYNTIQCYFYCRHRNSYLVAVNRTKHKTSHIFKLFNDISGTNHLKHTHAPLTHKHTYTHTHTHARSKHVIMQKHTCTLGHWGGHYTVKIIFAVIMNKLFFTVFYRSSLAKRCLWPMNRLCRCCHAWMSVSIIYEQM